VGWLLPHSKAVGKHLVAIFSRILIYNHYSHAPFFLFISNSTPKKLISKLLEKNNFIFYFETLFSDFIFSYSFSGTYSAPLDQVLCIKYLESKTSSQK
jgi:hypothetical protein